MLKLDLNLNSLNLPANRLNQNKSRANIFNKNLNFYVCSSGGCGSTLIYNYLKNFGNVFHIHDRNPPEKLCYIGDNNTNEPVYSEWFNKTEVPVDKLNTYKVIFIYRNPLQVIFSRFATPKGPNVSHLQHIQCDNQGQIYFGDVIRTGMDLYKLEEFFDNYTIPKKRNYSIICIKYEDFFNNISQFNKTLGIPDIKELYPVKKERSKTFTFVGELSIIYRSLIMKMNRMSFIEIIKPLELNNINDDNDA